MNTCNGCGSIVIPTIAFGRSLYSCKACGLEERYIMDDILKMLKGKRQGEIIVPQTVQAMVAEGKRKNGCPEQLGGILRREHKHLVEDVEDVCADLVYGLDLVGKNGREMTMQDIDREEHEEDGRLRHSERGKQQIQYEKEIVSFMNEVAASSKKIDELKDNMARLEVEIQKRNVWLQLNDALESAVNDYNYETMKCQETTNDGKISSARDFSKNVQAQVDLSVAKVKVETLTFWLGEYEEGWDLHFLNTRDIKMTIERT